MAQADTPTLGFLGGTGPEGKGLGLRYALAGFPVIIGSRDPERAQQVAAELAKQVPQGSFSGLDNHGVAREADIVFISVPFSAQQALLEPLSETLAGKTVISMAVPVAFSRSRIAAVPVEQGSAAEQAQSLLPGSRLVGAFQNVSAEELQHLDHKVECDVVVCADDADARAGVMALAERIPGLRGVNGGALENSRYVEEFTVLLLNINRQYRVKHSMVRIVGV